MRSSLFSHVLCITLAVLVVFLFTACGRQHTRLPEQDTLDAVKPGEIIATAKNRPVPGPPPFQEVFSPINPQAVFPARLYTLTFSGAPFSEALVAITNELPLNLTVAADVDMSRPITVRLKNVTFEEALDMVVTKGGGFAWRLEGATLQIKRFGEVFYHFDYLDMVGETNIEVGGDMLASGVENAGVAGKFQLKGERKTAQTDIWTAIGTSLAGMKSPDGVLQVSRSSGAIYMADTPARLQSMVAYLDAIKESLHRQVLIDAKIMEVRLSDQFQFGIDWDYFTSTLLSKTGDIQFTTDFATGRSGFFTMQFSGDTGRDVVSGFLEALSTQGDVTVLSNPHLAVMNGQSALMTVGFQFPYGDITGVDRDSETNIITYGTSIKRAILGLQMGVTPQISSEGLVTLHIVPTITRIQGQEAVEIPTSESTTQTVNNPIIDLQELATTVRVRSGQTVVLAGLISKTNSMDHKGVPWLSRAPLFGGLFKGINDQRDSRELVIVMTPYVKEQNGVLRAK